jgi:ribonuclease HI
LEGFANFLEFGRNAHLAELWSVFEGLKHVKQLNFRTVRLHIDFLVFVQNISVGTTLVERIRKLTDLDWKRVVHRSYCETIFCIGSLANH